MKTTTEQEVSAPHPRKVRRRTLLRHARNLLGSYLFMLGVVYGLELVTWRDPLAAVLAALCVFLGVELVDCVLTIRDERRAYAELHAHVHEALAEIDRLTAASLMKSARTKAQAREDIS